MKINIVTAACLTCFVIFCNKTDAQKIADTTAQQTFNIAPLGDSIKNKEPKSYFQVGASYVNDNVYFGRKDSVALPYLTPTLSYYSKSGFYATTSVGFLTSSSGTRFDMFDAAAGFAFSSGNYDGDFTATKYYYSSQSTSVKSGVIASIEYLSGYDFGFIRPTLLATLNIGTKLDIAATPAIEHSFFLLKDKAEITPTFLLNASTQNYYNDYYKVRRYSAKRITKLAPKGVKSISGEVINADEFKVLDYEVSVPLKYSFGKCQVSFTPVYAIPVHPADVAITTTLNNGTSTTRNGFEKLQNTFFGTLEFVCKF
jgi:hypothetical protein